MTTQRFHLRCGKCITFSNNNTVARRVDGMYDSVVLTEQPVALGTVFQVKILKYADDDDDVVEWRASIVSG